MRGKILMNHDGTQFYCWKHDRWFHHLKMVQCFYRGCLMLYEHMAPHRRKAKGRQHLAASGSDRCLSSMN